MGESFLNRQRRAYWDLRNFFIRRVFSIVFMLYGVITALWSLPTLIDPAATILINGEPSSDIVYKLIAFLFSIVIAILGVLLFRVKPWYPPGLEPTENKRDAT